MYVCVCVVQYTPTDWPLVVIDRICSNKDPASGDDRLQREVSTNRSAAEVYRWYLL